MTAPSTRRLISLLTSALLLVACASTSPPQPVAAVTIVPETTDLVVGATVQLRAAIWDADGHVLLGREVTWAHSDPGVGTVSATALVTAHARGSTTITATSEGRRCTSVVVVHRAMGV